MSSEQREGLFDSAYGDLGAAAESASAGASKLEERLGRLCGGPVFTGVAGRGTHVYVAD